MRHGPQDPGRCHYAKIVVLIVGTAAAIVCVIIGMCLLVQSLSSERALKLAACSDAITEWNDVGREQFNTLADAAVSVDNVVHPLQLVLGNSGDIDPLNELLSRKELPTYIATKYVLSGSDVIRQISWGDTKNVSVSLQYLLHPRGKDIQKMTIPPVPLLQVRVHPLTNAKACKFMVKGSWVQGKCESYHEAVVICAAVQQDQGQWVVENGCGGTSYGTNAAMANAPGTGPGYVIGYVRYKQVPGKLLLLGAGLPPEGAVDIADITIELRSTADPYISIERMTKGKLAFGDTEGNLNIAGGSFIVLGLCFLLPCCLWLIFWKASKLKAIETRSYDGDFDGDL